jgi:hypothetical protein
MCTGISGHDVTDDHAPVTFGAAAAGSKADNMSSSPRNIPEPPRRTIVVGITLPPDVFLVTLFFLVREPARSTPPANEVSLIAGEFSRNRDLLAGGRIDAAGSRCDM